MPIRIIRQRTLARAARALAAVAGCAAAGCSLLIDVPPKQEPDPGGMDGGDGGSRSPPPGIEGGTGGQGPSPPQDAAKDAGFEQDAGDAAPRDASPPLDAPPIDAACTGAPVAWYPDADRDGYGRSSNSQEIRFACARPGADWSAVAGDCADDNALVHPGQVTYFGTSYQRADGSDSFDYDCSSFEDGDLTVPISPKNCGLLSLALCGGMGYAATAREGPGLNPYCGSGVWSTCEAKGLGLLVCEATSVARDPPYGCR